MFLKEEGILPADWLWAQAEIWTLLWVSSLLACSVDLDLLAPKNLWANSLNSVSLSHIPSLSVGRMWSDASETSRTIEQDKKKSKRKDHSLIQSVPKVHSGAWSITAQCGKRLGSREPRMLAAPSGRDLSALCGRSFISSELQKVAASLNSRYLKKNC